MTAAIVAGLVRHILTVIGGAFLAKYGADLDPEAFDAVVGGAAATAGLVWSVFDKRARK